MQPIKKIEEEDDKEHDPCVDPDAPVDRSKQNKFHDLRKDFHLYILYCCLSLIWCILTVLTAEAFVDYTLHANTRKEVSQSSSRTTLRKFETRKVPARPRKLSSTACSRKTRN